MILHNVMWESRPLPKIVRRPPLLLSARGGLFLCSSPCWRTVGYERFLALHVILIVPGTSRGFFCFGGKACGEGNLFGKRFSLPVPHPSKNFCRWACARMESLVWRAAPTRRSTAVLGGSEKQTFSISTRKSLCLNDGLGDNGKKAGGAVTCCFRDLSLAAENWRCRFLMAARVLRVSSH